MPQRPIATVVDSQDFVIVDFDTPVLDVTRQMQHQHASCALIVEHGRLTGIFTERDATFRVIAAGRDPASTPVGDVVTHNPQTIGADKPFSHALHMMFEGGYRHLPVTDATGRPVGVVSARDALSLDWSTFSRELEQREDISVIL